MLLLAAAAAAIAAEGVHQLFPEYYAPSPAPTPPPLPRVGNGAVGPSGIPKGCYSAPSFPRTSIRHGGLGVHENRYVVWLFCQHTVYAWGGGGGEGKDQGPVVGRTGLRCTCFRRRGRLLRAFLMLCLRGLDGGGWGWSGQERMGYEGGFMQKHPSSTTAMRFTAVENQGGSRIKNGHRIKVAGVGIRVVDGRRAGMPAAKYPGAKSCCNHRSASAGEPSSPTAYLGGSLFFIGLLCSILSIPSNPF